MSVYKNMSEFVASEAHSPVLTSLHHLQDEGLMLRTHRKFSCTIAPRHLYMNLTVLLLSIINHGY